MDRTNRLQSRQAKAAQPATNPAAQPAAAAAPPAVVKHSCGCEPPLAAVAGAPCPACLSRIRRERAARKHAKQQTMHSQKYQTPRLPDGAVFTVAYDAASETWKGSLVVEGQTLTASASGVFRLLTQLDRQYRQQQPGSGS